MSYNTTDLFFQGKITIFFVLIAKTLPFIIELYRVEFRKNFISSKLSPVVEEYQLSKTTIKFIWSNIFIFNQMCRINKIYKNYKLTMKNKKKITYA